MAESSTIGKLVIQMLLDTQPFGEGTAKVEADVKKLGSSLTGFANSLNMVVVGAVKGATLALGGLAAATTAVGATFQQKMAYVGAMANATGEEFDALTQKARELGSTTTYSAAQVADAMALLAGSGLTAQQTMQATGDALVLAGVDGASMDTAAAALTSTMAQFSLQASDSARIADVFAQATAASQFKIESLSEAMKYAGTVGAGFGWSLEQTVAAAMMFRDAGLEGAKAGTALRSAMAQATMDSEKNRNTMAAYGLTMADVNPELHSFAEILATVGKAGMTTTDAMVIFGVEAGAVVKTLADQAAAGSTKYADFLSSLEGSTGKAAAMYATMNDTVMGSFKKLQSAASEILLTLFDTYKGPLADLLTAVGSVLSKTMAAIRGVSGEISASMDDAFGGVTAFLEENADYIASSLAGFLRGVSDFLAEVGKLAPLLKTILPLLDDIALTMGLIWVAMKVAAFVAGIENAIRVLAQMQWSIRALMADMTAATGGVYALVAALGVLVAGLIALISRYSEAEAKARALKAAQDALRNATEAENTARAKQLEALLAVQREQAKASMEQETAAGTLTQTRRNELELLSQLTGATAAQLETEGKLVVVRGQLRTAASIGSELDPETVQAFNRGVEEMAAKVEADTQRLDAMRKSLVELDKAAAETGTSGATGEAMQKMAAERRVALEALEAAIPKEKAALAKLQADYAKASMDVLQDVAKTEGKVRKERAKTSADGAAKQKEYVDKTLALHQGLVAELARIGKTELELIEQETDERIQKVKDEYAEQIKAAAGNAKEQARLRAQEQEDITAVEKLGEQKRLALVVDNARKGAEAREQERKRLQDVITSMEEEDLAKSVQLEREKVRVLAEIDDQYGSQKAQIAELYNAKIKQAQEEEAAEAQRLADETAEEQVTALQRVEVAWYLIRMAVWTVVDAVQRATDAIQGAWQAAVGFVSYFADALATLTGFSFSLSDALSSIQDSLSKSIGEVQASGGVTVSARAPSARREGETETAYAARQYVENLVAGAATFADLLVQAVPALLTALVEGIPKVVDVFVAEVPVLVQAFVDALPGLVDVLVTQLPRVVQAMVDGVVVALPAVVDAILAALPPLLQALVKAGAEFVGAVLDSLPRLLVGLVQMVPGLFNAILAELPTLIQKLVAGVADVVVALIMALPMVLDALVAALPDLIGALLVAVIEAIPKLIVAVVLALPRLIAAVITAIPTIIGAVVAQLPLLVTTLIGLIPQLFLALVQALPSLLPAIVALIPQLIAATVPYLPQIAVALFEAVIIEIPKMIPELAKAIGQAFVDAGSAIFKAIKKALKAAWDALTDFFGGGNDKGSHYAGINYVPATMRVTVHPGEMVVPKNRNPMASDRPNPALAGAPGGFASQAPVHIGLYSDGRLVEEALVNGQRSGKATQVKRMMRSTAKVKAGVDRGRFNPWSK